MAKEEPEETEAVYVLVETGQYLKAGDEVFFEQSNRWQTMSPTVDGFTLVPGLKVRRKVSVSQRQHYIFLEKDDICQAGDELYFTNTTGNFWRPVFEHMHNQKATGVFMVRRKVVHNV